MAKVTYEFDENEEGRDIELINSRYKMICALNDLSDLKRKLYKGWLSGEDLINVKDNRVLQKEDYDKIHKEGKLFIEGSKQFISYDYIESAIDRILNDIYFLLD